MKERKLARFIFIKFLDTNKTVRQFAIGFFFRKIGNNPLVSIDLLSEMVKIWWKVDIEFCLVKFDMLALNPIVEYVRVLAER